MIKKTAIVVTAAMFALLLSACGSGGSVQSNSESQAVKEPAADSSALVESQEEEFDPMVDSIDMSLEGGGIRYNHMEVANKGLTDSENALVFVFDFTNEQSKPAQVQSVYRIQFFQNGVELPDTASYSADGGDQYELVSAFFSDVMKGGTVTFGQICVPKDDSPITIMVSPNGLPDDVYQTMEVAIDSSDAKGDVSTSVSAEEIDAMLQGTWVQGDVATITFDNGTISIESSGQQLLGTYEIDMANSQIKGHMEATDGTVGITLPYEYDGEILKFYNNRGEEATRA